jgi:hypothetical protein
LHLYSQPGLSGSKNGDPPLIRPKVRFSLFTPSTKVASHPNRDKKDLIVLLLFVFIGTYVYRVVLFANEYSGIVSSRQR